MSALIQVPNVGLLFNREEWCCNLDIERRSGAKIKIRPPKAGESLREASIVGNSDSVSRKGYHRPQACSISICSRQQLQAQQLQFMQQQRSPQFYQQEQNSPEIRLRRLCSKIRLACARRSRWVQMSSLPHLDRVSGFHFPPRQLGSF